MDTPHLGAVEMGAGGDAPVVFLHGFGMTSAIWGRDVQPAIARSHQTIAYDLPGHAASLGFPDAVSAGSFARAVAADLASRGIGRVHLVGHSMGGATATLMATAAPDRVASLTLIAPGGFGPEVNHRLIVRFGTAQTREALLAALEMMFGWRNEVPEGLVSLLVAMRAVPGQVEALGAIAGRMARSGHQGVIPPDAVAALGMPVKVIWGVEDCVLPARHAEGLPGHFAVHRFPDAGHMLVEEIPEAVTALIRQNLA